MLNTTDAAMMSNMVASDAVVRAHYTHTHTDPYCIPLHPYYTHADESSHCWCLERRYQTM